jgi:hypothetical protein
MSELSYFEKQELGSILEKLAATIDLTEAQYREANEKYTAVGNFISHPNMTPNWYHRVPCGSGQ